MQGAIFETKLFLVTFRRNHQLLFVTNGTNKLGLPAASGARDNQHIGSTLRLDTRVGRFASGYRVLNGGYSLLCGLPDCYFGMLYEAFQFRQRVRIASLSGRTDRTGQLGPLILGGWQKSERLFDVF